MMLDEILSQDRLARELFERAGIPFAQLDSLLVRATSPGESYTQQARKRSRRSISKGSYVRSLRQGKSAVSRTIYRLFLLQYLELIGPGSVEGLVRVSQTLARTRHEPVTGEGVENILQIVDKVARLLPLV
jgi:hypothetical protein